MRTIEQNFAAASSALAAALRDDPFYRAIAGPAGRGQVELLTRYFAYSLEEGHRIGKVRTHGDPAAGAAVWITASDPGLKGRLKAAKREYLRDLLGAAGLSRYLEIVEYMEGRIPAHVGPSAWYLSILGVCPGLQGAGIGSALIGPTVREADAEGAVCFLETFNPEGVGFYRRHGFGICLSAIEPVTSSEYWLMLRDPSGPLGESR